MNFKKTTLSGVWIIEPRIFEDDRGYFFEAFREEVFRKQGLDYQFIQDNMSYSKKGTIRGLHYQIAPHEQAKLVMAVKGSILDVAVDIRKKSPTFGQHFSTILSEENRQMMLVPSGFAHGFSVLSDEATVCYKCNAYYHKAAERGIRWNDPEININWRVNSPVLSEKDQTMPLLEHSKQEDLF